jgi:hypothetical protein
VFIAGYFSHDIIKPPVTITKIDTVSVVEKIDSVKFANQVLINAAAKIEQYDINPDGIWVKRKPVIKWLPGDTIIIDSTKYFKVAGLDTNLVHTKDSVISKDTLSLKFAYEIGALKFKYTSNLIDKADSSHYNLFIDGKYFDGVWNIVLNEDYLLTKKTITVTRDISLPPKPLGFWDRFVFGPTIAVGYGTFNRTFDTYVGFGVMYNIK